MDDLSNFVVWLLWHSCVVFIWQSGWPNPNISWPKKSSLVHSSGEEEVQRHTGSRFFPSNETWTLLVASNPGFSFQILCCSFSEKHVFFPKLQDKIQNRKTAWVWGYECLILALFPVLHHNYHHLHHTASDDSCGGGLGTRLTGIFVTPILNPFSILGYNRFLK